MHKTTGAVIVSNGVFNASGSCTFANVPTAYVAANGTLKVESAAATAVFGGLKTLTLENGGQFVVANTCTVPLTDNQTALSVGSTSVVSASNRTLRFRSVFMDGVVLAAGTYTAANATWIANDGTTVVVGETLDQWSAADGNWNQAGNWMAGIPDGTKRVFVTKPQGTYTVTVSDARSVNGGLDLGNTVPGGTATLMVASGGTLTYNGAGTNLGMEEVAVCVGKGGRLDAEGDVMVTNLTGRFEIRDGGVVSVTNAAFGLQTLATDSSTTNHALYVMKGGLLAFGGTATCNVASAPLAGQQQQHLVNDGGEIRFGGDSLFYPGGGWMNLFGSGRTIFEGAAQLKRGPSTLTQLRYYFTPTSEGVENMALIEFRDDAKMSFTADDAVYVNFGALGCDHHVKMIFDSTSMSTLGELKCGMRGFTELDVRRGWLNIGGGFGMHVAARASEYTGATGDAACTSVVRVAENAVLHLACGWVGNKGLIIGDGRVDQIVPRHALGILENSGTVTNWYGVITLGSGAAEGRLVMKGGTFYSRVTNQGVPMTVGFANGLGVFAVSNGVFELGRQPLYVGGVPTADLACQPGSGNMPETAYALRHDAEGFMTVAAEDFTKPCRFSADTVKIGMDGTGTVMIGPGGCAEIGNLTLNGEKSELVFTVTENGAGTLVCDTIDIEPGSRLRVDVCGYSAAKTQQLIRWTTQNGAFSDGDVAFSTDCAKYRLNVDGHGVRLVEAGFTVLVR